IEELARRCGTTPPEAAAAMEATMPLCSLSDFLWGGEDGPTVESALSDEEEAERNLNRLALSAAMDKLPSLRQQIIRLRYYEDLSQQQVADRLGLTQVKVSREEKKILAFLAKELA
ncbi:MAG: sigma-70 family RNA polymerase sigma factor, partial [Clostridia bacterium]|nr:sigma-70 family RNA polymerase sigma factor [Clostridia bacterium]